MKDGLGRHIEKGLVAGLVEEAWAKVARSRSKHSIFNENERRNSRFSKVISTRTT